MEKIKEKIVKCLIWDLDNTLWDGVITEDKTVALREGAAKVVKTLDERGILQSIASRNNYHEAMEQICAFGLDKYFLYPQINWGNKSASVARIIEELNIGADTVAFIDDQQFELDEVLHSFPEVFCLLADEYQVLIDHPRFMPPIITADTRRRREMYLSDKDRNQAELAYEGPQEEFLRSLWMRLSILPAEQGDLMRVIELTERTNQLNTTGYTYSYEQLEALRVSREYKLLIIGLEDIYGTYGKVGLVLLNLQEEEWIIDLFIMSCRVMSRGIGTVVMNYLMKKAKLNQKRLFAKFIQTDRNRMMLLSYSLAGFHPVEEKEGYTLLENDLLYIRETPDYMELRDS